MASERPDPEAVDPRLGRHGGISYMHIPALDVRRAAAFYGAVLGWTIHNGDSDRPGFEDGGRHVGGAWVTSQEIAREPGLLPYIYVDDIDAAVERVGANGGDVVRSPYPEGNLLVATFHDSEGNVLGLWQAQPSAGG